MGDEQKMMSLGVPFSEAAGICWDLRRNGEDPKTYLTEMEKETMYTPYPPFASLR